MFQVLPAPDAAEPHEPRGKDPFPRDEWPVSQVLLLFEWL